MPRQHQSHGFSCTDCGGLDFGDGCACTRTRSREVLLRIVEQREMGRQAAARALLAKTKKEAK